MLSDQSPPEERPTALHLASREAEAFRPTTDQRLTARSMRGILVLQLGAIWFGVVPGNHSSKSVRTRGYGRLPYRYSRHLSSFTARS